MGTVIAISEKATRAPRPLELSRQLAAIVSEECKCSCLWDHDDASQRPRGKVTADELKRIQDRISWHFVSVLEEQE